MKKQFPGYYQLLQREFETLWHDATIILDTNVLLYAYKTPSQGREALLKLLEDLKGRVWVPYQVAMEFQVNRLGVIASEKKRMDAALKASEGALLEITESLKSLDIDAREIGVEGGKLQGAITDARQLIADALTKARDLQPSVTHDDPIRTRIDAVLENSIGPAPMDQKELEEKYTNCKNRYDLSMPPGFKDIGKSNESKDDAYLVNGIKYERQYGDSLLWLQILDYVNTKKKKNVILVTMDVKEDWWLRKDGLTLGPHPELISEIKRVGGVELFWMYTLPRFMEQSREYLKIDLSARALEEVKEVAVRQLTADLAIPRAKFTGARSDQYEKMYDSAAEIAILDWLTFHGIEAAPSGAAFPDLIIRDSSGEYGVDVMRVMSFPLSVSKLHMKLLQAETSVRQGRFLSMSIILVCPFDLIRAMENSEDFFNSNIYRPLKKLSEVMRNVGIVVGYLETGSFYQVCNLAPHSELASPLHLV